jgi:hypothetical protein
MTILSNWTNGAFSSLLDILRYVGFEYLGGDDSPLHVPNNEIYLCLQCQPRVGVSGKTYGKYS